MMKRHYAPRTVPLLGLLAICAFGVLPALAEGTDDWPEQSAERLQAFQGAWQAYGYGTDDSSWSLVIDGDTFRGKQGPDDWYTGTILVRDDRDPGWVDLRITDSTYQKGKTCHAIFRLTGETILMAAPPPDEERRKEITKDDGGISVELKRVPIR